MQQPVGFRPGHGWLGTSLENQKQLYRMFKLEATTVSMGCFLVKTGLDGGQTPKPEAGLKKTQNSPRILLSLD